MRLGSVQVKQTMAADPADARWMTRGRAGVPAGKTLNAKAKGTRAELRTMRLLERAGYSCTRSSASLGLFDVIAIGQTDVRLIQVKAGSTYLSTVERAAIQALVVPANVRCECWRFPDRAQAPLIERL